ncbi:MAG: hypothetical protein WC124_10775 [Desulfoplanes sp.]
MTISTWEQCFTEPEKQREKEAGVCTDDKSVSTLARLKKFLDRVHIKYCLVRPFFEQRSYPLVDPRELLPSFEADLFEYPDLPGFSMVAFDRQLSYFNEMFQFDLLHSPADENDFIKGQTCPLELAIHKKNVQVFLNRLPKKFHDDFKKFSNEKDLTNLENYSALLDFLLKMDRGHVMALDAEYSFYFSGIFASFPSDIDAELKRFGLRIHKFDADNNRVYEQNRDFVYQFLMELYGFPVVSERRTSAAMFARRLYKMGETFLIRVLGQSDRTITTYYPHPGNKYYPRVEKIALVNVSKQRKEIIRFLQDNGFMIHPHKKVIILKITYTQHKYGKNNVREDRALSVLKQEVIHPGTGMCCTSLNIIKDTYSMTLQLNDIVRGEFKGKIKYKKHEIIENTDTHTNRLKFLHSWLSKHQRRIIGYSDEFYINASKLLEHYLLDEAHASEFNELRDLYQEVWAIYSYIQQARKIQQLEDLSNRLFQGKRISYCEMLEHMIEIMSTLKFEIVRYFDPLVIKAIAFGDDIINSRYIQSKYITPKEDTLTPYGLSIRKLYGRLVALLDEFKAIRKSHVDKSGSAK